tara:strand:+ start:4591 stop:5277 length:687 start_codon:yes stop_codon:yes gene_type:complete
MKKKCSKTNKSKGGYALPRERVPFQPLSIRQARIPDDAPSHPIIQELRDALGNEEEEMDPYAFSEALDRAYFDYDTLVDVFMSTRSPRGGFDYAENYFIAIQDLVNTYLTIVQGIDGGQPIYDLHQDIFHNSRSQQGQFGRIVNQLDENEELQGRYRRGVVGSRYWTDEYRRLNDLFAEFFVRLGRENEDSGAGGGIRKKKIALYRRRKRKFTHKRKKGKKKQKTRKN